MEIYDFILLYALFAAYIIHNVQLHSAYFRNDSFVQINPFLAYSYPILPLVWLHSYLHIFFCA